VSSSQSQNPAFFPLVVQRTVVHIQRISQLAKFLVSRHGRLKPKQLSALSEIRRHFI
jgi:hypothetical protein